MARTPEKCRCAGEGMRGRNRDSCFLSHRLLTAGTRYSGCLPAHKQRRLEKAKNHSRYRGKTPGDQSPGSCLPPSLSPFLCLKGVPQHCQESSFKADAGRCTFDLRSDPLCDSLKATCLGLLGSLLPLPHILHTHAPLERLTLATEHPRMPTGAQ